MIYGRLSAPDTYRFLLVNPAWKQAFDWLQTVTPQTPAGRSAVRGEEIYANVHGYETLPAKDCLFESHRRYVDLQYCITGNEAIQWALAGELRPTGEYSAEDDILFYARPAHAVTSLQMVPGAFAIFAASDAHAPKVSNGSNGTVFKVVVKVDARLLGWSPG